MDTFSQRKRSWIMAQVKSTGNKSTENSFRSLLRKQKLTGWRRRYPLFGKPDFVFPKKRVAIFVDGCFWHGHPTKCRMPKVNRRYWIRKIVQNVARDKLVTKNLSQRGWKVIRIWEDAIWKLSTVSKLKKVLN